MPKSKPKQEFITKDNVCQIIIDHTSDLSTCPSTPSHSPAVADSCEKCERRKDEIEQLQSDTNYHEKRRVLAEDNSKKLEEILVAVEKKNAFLQKECEELRERLKSEKDLASSSSFDVDKVKSLEDEIQKTKNDALEWKKLYENAASQVSQYESTVGIKCENLDEQVEITRSAKSAREKDLQDKNTGLQNAYNDLKNSHSAMLIEKSTQIANLKTDLKDKKDTVTRLKNQLETAYKKLDKKGKKDEVNKISKQLEESVSVNSILNLKIKELEGQLSSNIKVTEHSKEMKKEYEEMAKSIELFEMEKKDRIIKMKILKKEKTDVEEKLRELEKTAELKNNEMSKLKNLLQESAFDKELFNQKETEMRTLKSDLLSAKTELTKLNKKSENEANTYQDEINKLTTTNKEKKDEIKSLRKQLKAKKNQSAPPTSKTMEVLSSTIDSLHANLASQAKENKEAIAKEKKSHFEIIQKMNLKVSNDNKAFQDKIKSLEQSVKLKETEISSLKKKRLQTVNMTSKNETLKNLTKDLAYRKNHGSINIEKDDEIKRLKAQIDSLKNATGPDTESLQKKYDDMVFEKNRSYTDLNGRYKARCEQNRKLKDDFDRYKEKTGKYIAKLKSGGSNQKPSRVTTSSSETQKPRNMMTNTEKKLDKKDKTRSDLNGMTTSSDKGSNRVSWSIPKSQDKNLTADPRKRPQSHSHHHPPFKRKPLLDGPRELQNFS